MERLKGTGASTCGTLVRCVVRSLGDPLSSQMPRMATPSAGAGPEDAPVALEIALLRAIPLPLPWEELTAFAPEAFVFSSGNAVDAFFLQVQERREWPAAVEEPQVKGHPTLASRFPLFVAVGATTATKLASKLAEPGFQSGTGDELTPGPWTIPGAPVLHPPKGAGLEATLAYLAQRSLPPRRIAVLGARDGKAGKIGPEDVSGGIVLLAVPCYDVVPLIEGANELAALVQARAAHPRGNVPMDLVLDVGSAAVALAALDALSSFFPLGSLPAGVKFLPRHRSAREALLSRFAPEEASTRLLP
jgi:hypothetical protein